jgi:dipeptidyl aminopeptidase/acylaminoacyl peptidase
MSISRFLITAPFVISLARAQLPIEQTVDELFRTKELKETALSPDGKRVAWVQPGTQEDSEQIWTRELTEGSIAPTRISAGRNAREEHGIAWSPDSTRIAFLSDAESKGQAQLYVAPWKGKARRVTTVALKGELARPQWSPDGRQLALLYTKDAPRSQGALEPTSAPSGEIDSAIFYQRITIVDVASGASKEVSPGDQYVYEFSWSPDGKQFVYTSAPGPGENNWWIARLYTIDIATGAAKEIAKPEWQITAPRWSPDGKSIAYISGLMSDEGVTGGDIFIVPAEGGTPRNVTPGRKGSPSWIEWMPSSQRLLFSESVKGSVGVAMLDLSTGSTETIWKGDETAAAGRLGFGMYDLSLSKDGTQAAVIRHSFAKAPEVWAGPIGQWKQVTHLNDGLKKLWGEARSVEWKSDGFDVQGWLVEPARYDPAKKYPMVVVIHGGPSSAQKPAWRGAFFNTTTLSEQGYFVFYPNPRGSYGQGAQFTEANRKDFGYGDLQDVLRGLDAVLAKYPVDANRVGVTGWSYGGFMTMWTVTQTNRFKAAVAGAGIANWLSYYGENSIDQWMIPFFGATVYDDPEVYKKSSPITYIKNVKTPTLVLVGERDGECPAPQSYEFWHALKTSGVKTSLVVYPGEGHRFHDREHMRDLMKRTLAWFNDNLK